MSHPIGAEPWKSQPRQTKVGKPRQETQKKTQLSAFLVGNKMEKWTTWFPELYLVLMSLNLGPVLVKVITLGFQQCLQSYPAWSTLRKSELERSTHFIWVNPIAFFMFTRPGMFLLRYCLKKAAIPLQLLFFHGFLYVLASHINGESYAMLYPISRHLPYPKCHIPIPIVSPFNGNPRILKWRYVNVPYVWPYVGIYPEI